MAPEASRAAPPIPPGTTRRLAEFVASARYEDLTPEAVAQTKLLILDSFAAQLGGYQTDLGSIAVDLARDEGGACQATIVGTRERVAAPSAAAANARCGATLDADDTFNTVTHHGSPVVATALAFAESLHRSGRDLLAAVAVGFDVGARLGASVGPPRISFDPGQGKAARLGGGPVPYLATAATAAHLLRLDAGRVAHAFGITSLYAPQPPEKLHELDEQPLMKASDAGWQALGGITGARLAQRGATGFDTILEGEHGLWKMQGADHCNLDLLLGQLSQKWFILDTTFKRWPCQRWVQYSLTAFERIRSQEQLRPDEIERVLVIANVRTGHRRFANPHPRELIACEFSYPHAIAMVALGVPPGPQWFTPSAIEGAAAEALRRRVDVVVPPEARAEDPSWFAEGQIRRLPSGVEVTARGRAYRLMVDRAFGDPWDDETRFGEAELLEKLRSFAGPLAASDTRWWQQLDRLANAVLTLEQMEDVRDLGDLLGR